LLTARHPVPSTTITPNEPGVVTAGSPPGHHATHRRGAARPAAARAGPGYSHPAAWGAPWCQPGL